MDAIHSTALIAATLTMGIAAGVYALYALAIMPGLARTDDRTFVGAFQQIDTAIVGPFLLVFFVGPVATGVWAAVLHFGDADRTVFGFIAAAVGLHVFTALLTIGINVPLNNRIKAAGDPAGISDLSGVRRRFNEARWVRWNRVRVLTTTTAFGLIAWSLVLYGGY